MGMGMIEVAATPSRRYLQSPTTECQGPQRHFPLEDYAHHSKSCAMTPYSRRVLAPLLPTRLADRLSAYLLFRLSR